MNAREFKADVKRLGFTLRRFADMMGVNASSLYTWMSCESLPQRVISFLELVKENVQLKQELEKRDTEIKRLREKISELI